MCVLVRVREKLGFINCVKARCKPKLNSQVTHPDGPRSFPIDKLLSQCLDEIFFIFIFLDEALSWKKKKLGLLAA